MTGNFRIIAIAVGLASCSFGSNCVWGQEILTLQNAKRSRHCAPALTWSSTLAAAAQSWANGCSKGHSAPNTRPNQGENLAWGSGSFATASSSVDRWYNEDSQYNFSAPGFSNATGHFTQMVWRSSREVGCGSAVCGGETFWVCRYSPAGNITNPGQFAQNVLPTTCAGSTSPTPSPGAPGGPPTPPPPAGGASGDWSAFATNSLGRWGFAAHRASQSSASTEALNGCGGAAAGCKVFWTTQDRCVSYAESRSGGYWYAAGGGTTDDQARQKAIGFCQSGKAPPNSCKNTGAWCK
jgi:glioma pathogenesis-related protein 2